MSMPSVFVKVTIGAAEIPLECVSTFKGSDLTIGVIDVPKNRFGLEITGVNVRVENALEAAINVAAVRKGNVYVATFPASHFALSGSVNNGVTVTLTGQDENGAERSWVAGKGDLVVMAADGSVRLGEDYKTLHWFAAPPASPCPGDVAPIEGLAKVWSGSAWVDFAGGGSSGTGAVVLRIDGGKVYKGDKEVALFSDLLAMVQAGGVTLLNTVGGNPKDALYYPHYCDDTGIRFDATGILGSAVQTRSIVMQPKSGGGIIITPGSLTELAKKADIEGFYIRETPNASGREDFLVGRTFGEAAIDNQAIVKAFTVPSGIFKTNRFVRRLSIRAANTDAGVWDHNAGVFIQQGEKTSESSSSVNVVIGRYFELPLFVPLLAGGYSPIEVTFTGVAHGVRLALVEVDPSLGYSVTLSNGNVLTGYAPVVDFIGSDELRSNAIDSVTPVQVRLSAVKSLASNASQSQIIAKINELLAQFK